MDFVLCKSSRGDWRKICSAKWTNQTVIQQPTAQTKIRELYIPRVVCHKDKFLVLPLWYSPEKGVVLLSICRVETKVESVCCDNDYPFNTATILWNCGIRWWTVWLLVNTLQKKANVWVDVPDSNNVERLAEKVSWFVRGWEVPKFQSLLSLEACQLCWPYSPLNSILALNSEYLYCYFWRILKVQNIGNVMEIIWSACMPIYEWNAEVRMRWIAESFVSFPFTFSS